MGRARWGPDWRVLFGAVGQPKTQLRVQKAEARCRLGSVCAVERLWEAESTWGSSPAAAGGEQSLVQMLLSTAQCWAWVLGYRVWAGCGGRGEHIQRSAGQGTHRQPCAQPGTD